jgi:hypothetical protein
MYYEALAETFFGEAFLVTLTTTAGFSVTGTGVAYTAETALRTLARETDVGLFAVFKVIADMKQNYTIKL